MKSLHWPPLLHGFLGLHSSMPTFGVAFIVSLEAVIMFYNKNVNRIIINVNISILIFNFGVLKKD